MKKRLSSILRSMVIGGLVTSGVARVLILFTASPVPDPASGRTEPSLFAPAISTNWDYITPVQTWLLIMLTSVTLICVGAWPVAAWMERRADAGANRLRPDMPSNTTVRPVPGRRHHAHARAGGGRPLLDELHVAASAGAVRAGPRLGRREPALLAAVHRALARHHACSVIWPGPPRPPRPRCSSGSARAADSSAWRRRGTAPSSRTPWGLRARRRPSPLPP